MLCAPEQPPFTVDSYTMRTWHWVRVPGLRLPPGDVTLDLLNREDGVWVDQLCVRPAGQPAPVGVLSALTAWPPPGPGVPAIGVVTAPGGPGLEALPPTEYLLHHSRTPRLNLPRQPLLVVFPGQTTPLDVWLRRNRLAGLPGTLRIDGPAAIVVEPADALPLPAVGPLLECRSFSVRAHPDLPRGLTHLYCRIESADGLEQVRAVRVLRPYRWMVSQPLRLNPRAGLDQRTATDAAVLADPLGSSHGITWHAVEPGHFTPFGLLDLRRAVSAEPLVEAYAFARCRGSGERATLDLTHDDWIRVWVNGVCVFSSTESAPSTLTRTRVPVTLRAGDNDLLVRCAQLKNYWEFGLVAERVDDSTAIAPPAAAGEAPVPTPVAGSAGPLPPWSLEAIAQDLPALVGDVPPGQGWTVFAAACREGLLTPVAPWRYLSATMQRLACGLEERRHCAEALLELRRRTDLAVLPKAESAALRSLTFRDRVAFLSSVAPVEAAEESLAAACWTDSQAEQQALYAEGVRLYLCGDAIAEASACADSLTGGLAEGESLRGVVALYQGDRVGAAASFGELRPDQAGRYAGWLLDLGRAAEAEWLLRRVATPSVWNRLALAEACLEQRRFAEGEALLLECLRRDDAPRSGWETAAAKLAAFHAARCSLAPASARFRTEAEALTHHRQAYRARLMQVLCRLAQEAHEPVEALRDALAAAELSANSYREPTREDLGALLQPALSRLVAEGRHAAAIDLCNQTVAVAPGLRLQVDALRLQALQGLGLEGAAEAVLARLLAVVAADPAQARCILSLRRDSEPLSSAAERLAQAVLEGHSDVPLLSADTAVAPAYAAARLEDVRPDGSGTEDDETESAVPGDAQLLPVLMGMLRAGRISQITMDADDSPSVWVVEHGRFPFRVELGASDTATRFDPALRPFGEPIPVGRTVVFLHGLAWIGTDRGLFCYDAAADSWDRLRLPGGGADTPILGLSAEDGRLQVAWSSATGREIQGVLSPESGDWETRAAP